MLIQQSTLKHYVTIKFVANFNKILILFLEKYNFLRLADFSTETKRIFTFRLILVPCCWGNYNDDLKVFFV